MKYHSNKLVKNLHSWSSYLNKLNVNLRTMGVINTIHNVIWGSKCNRVEMSEAQNKFLIDC